MYTFFASKGGKDPPENPRQIQIRIWEASQPKSTLQGSIWPIAAIICCKRPHRHPNCGLDKILRPVLVDRTGSAGPRCKRGLR